MINDTINLTDEVKTSDLLNLYRQCLDEIIKMDMPSFEQMEQIENILDDIFKQYPEEVYNTFDYLYTTVLTLKGGKYGRIAFKNTDCN